jgi:hypothetical protein
MLYQTHVHIQLIKEQWLSMVNGVKHTRKVCFGSSVLEQQTEENYKKEVTSPLQLLKLNVK